MKATPTNLRYNLRYVLGFALIAVLFLCAPALAGKKVDTVRQIAITFDDLPMVAARNPKVRAELTEDILGVLRRWEIKSAGFVIGNNIDSDWELLIRWLDEGHILGNHSFSHVDFHENSIQSFLSDVAKGASTIEPALSSFKQKRRYFRYPYLHYGTMKSPRKKVAEAITNDNTRLALVSVATEDYLYNLSLQRYAASRDSAVFAGIRDEYIESVLRAIVNAEDRSWRLIGRNVRHILLLHANKLNAMFLDELLESIAAIGYTFISFERALSDKVYRKKDSYYGSRGVSILERIELSQPDLSSTK